jgi:hypothetical protein
MCYSIYVIILSMLQKNAHIQFSTSRNKWIAINATNQVKVNLAAVNNNTIYQYQVIKRKIMMMEAIHFYP